MPTARKHILLALSLALLCAGAAHAQGESREAAPQDNYVRDKGFSNYVFQLKHRDPLNLVRVLGPLSSGFRGAALTPNADFRTITVRDFPENIAAMRDAINRLDVPEPPHPGIEFQVHLLVASNDDRQPGRYPEHLGEVVRRLQTSLGYKNFTLMGSQVLRSREGRGEIHNKGVADFKIGGDTLAGRNPVFYEYHLRAFSIDATNGPARVEVEDFALQMKVPLMLSPDKITYNDVGFKNPVALREGERVVVGTTSMADKSVVVILSATTMK